MSDEVISTDGGSVSQYYQVNKAVADHLQSINFEERAKKIFSPVSKSVGERVAQGLGWMARGRRAHDRAERFLFFYTAIEALLASSDRTAPVIQTIARHAAVILAEKVEKRYEIAKNIKTSYETRSALVHGGRRNVSKTEADDAQLMAEILYLEILEKVDLASSDESFEAGLSIASYGLRWPAENSYRDTDE
jgi:Apea-like HEPN